MLQVRLQLNMLIINGGKSRASSLAYPKGNTIILQPTDLGSQFSSCHVFPFSVVSCRLLITGGIVASVAR